MSFLVALAAWRQPTPLAWVRSTRAPLSDSRSHHQPHSFLSRFHSSDRRCWWDELRTGWREQIAYC